MVNKEMVQMEKKRVLISGAGIAGFTLAYWLKKRGFEPTIIEKHPFLREGGYKVDVRGIALEVARRMRIYDELLEKRVNLTQSKLVTPKHKILDFEGDILGHCSEGDIEVNRWDLVQILSNAVSDVEIIFGDSITEIGELVHFEKGEPRKFDLVVGADGLFSNVRRLAFGSDSQFLRKYGVYFCIFPAPNIFDLDHAEIVYFNQGKFMAAYAAKEYSYACLAFRSEQELLADELSGVFEEQFEGLGWEIPRLCMAMKESGDCYYNSLAQVRMPYWSKGKVALVGDAAYAASAMGTSLALVGSYVLAREIAAANGDHEIAFPSYENAIRKFVVDAQDLVESDHQILSSGSSSIKLTLQLYLMKIMPKKSIQFLSKRGREQMRKVANNYDLEEDSNTDGGSPPPIPNPSQNK